MIDYSQRGSYYVEALVSIGIVAIMSLYILPAFPNLARSTRDSLIYSKLNLAADYIGQYVHRWSQFDTKTVYLNDYQNGDEFEPNQEKRINRLAWADTLNQEQVFSDEYKTSITLWELDSRLDNSGDAISAVVKIVVWYDQNLNSIQDASEPQFTVSTTIIER